MTTTLEEGRRAYERRAWTTAYECLRAADGEQPLGPEDLEMAGRAAYLAGLNAESDALLERAFAQRIRRGEAEDAALDGFLLAFGLLNRGEWAGPVAGWPAPPRPSRAGPWTVPLAGTC
jgi:hypothetical protein